MPGIGHLSWQCWPIKSHRPQDLEGYSQSPWLPSRIAENITYLGHRIWRYQAGNYLETYALLASFHINGRCYVKLAEEKIISSLAQLLALEVKVMTGL